MQEIFLHSIINFKGEQINMKYDYLVVGAGLYGGVFALDGNIQKFGQIVILCSPAEIGVQGTISLGSPDDFEDED